MPVVCTIVAPFALVGMRNSARFITKITGAVTSVIIQVSAFGINCDHKSCYLSAIGNFDGFFAWRGTITADRIICYDSGCAVVVIGFDCQASGVEIIAFLIDQFSGQCRFF